MSSQKGGLGVLFFWKFSSILVQGLEILLKNQGWSSLIDEDEQGASSKIFLYFSSVNTYVFFFWFCFPLCCDELIVALFGFRFDFEELMWLLQCFKFEIQEKVQYSTNLPAKFRQKSTYLGEDGIF